MLNLLSRVELDDYWTEREGIDDRRNILRRQIAFYRQNLRQTIDAEFAAIYVREIVHAQSELAGLLDGDAQRPPKVEWQTARRDTRRRLQ